MTTAAADQPEPRALAWRVLSRMLADERRAAALAQDLDDWLAVQPIAPEHRSAHLAAKAVDVGLAAIESGTDPVPPPAWIAGLEGAPVAVRAAVALRVLAGHPSETVARWCARSVDQVDQLVAMVPPWDPPPEAPPLPAPVAPSATEPPAVVPPPPPAAPSALPPLPAVVEAPQPAAEPQPQPEPRPEPEPEPEPRPEPEPEPEQRTAEVGAPPPAVAPPMTPLPAEPPRRRRRVRRIVTSLTLLAVVGGAVATAAMLAEPPERPSFRPSSPATVGPSTEISKPVQSSGCAGPDGESVVSGEMVVLDVAGQSRAFRLTAAAPEQTGTPRGLVVAVPDLNEPVELLLAESGIETLGDEQDVAVATLLPVRTPPQWNVLGAGDEPNDIVYASTVVDAVEARLCIDEHRVAVVGKGAGGHFAAALACAEPDRYHLVAMVAAAYQPASCGALTDTTVVVAVGGADDIFPLTGGLGPGFSGLVPDPNSLGAGSRYDPPSFDAAISGWAQVLDCDPAEGRAVFDGPPPAQALTGNRLTACRGRSSLITVDVTDAGHEWTPAAGQIIREQLTARRSG